MVFTLATPPKLLASIAFLNCSSSISYFTVCFNLLHEYLRSQAMPKYQLNKRTILVFDLPFAKS